MASRRDIYQSYQFTVQRVVSGLVLRETDPAQVPLRRLGGTMFASIMVAVIALAITGVIGVINPGGNKTWKSEGKVIVEEDTGAQFVWLKNPETGEFLLHPVLNLASGALLVGTSQIVEVSHASLEGAPRGPRLGIPDAPDSIPPTDDFLTGPWTLCSLPAQTQSGELVPSTALVVGRERSSGIPIDDSIAVVNDIEAGAVYLVWNGHRFLAADPTAVLTGLGLRDVPQIEAGTAMLTALPDGGTLAPSAPAGRGQPSSTASGLLVGQIVMTSSGSDASSYYLVLDEGLQAISEVQALITLADPTLSTAYPGAAIEAIEIPAAQANQLPHDQLGDPQFSDPPRVPPAPALVQGKTSTICASFSSGTAEIDIAVEAQVEGADTATATPQRTQNGAVLADQVLTPSGSAALVRSVMSPTAEEGPLYLVTDEGRKWAIPDDEALQSLGLTSVEPVLMPASLVARIPEGSALDKKAAGTPS
ncbi:type VII secretion protein EccB [Epidermidibacterium keratini]|uniref:Type VII secretion protein EccB n=1 Tax=Epidermidibacterium keratini TaxID=1891644 RepID=A0A7L4YPP1_9ACTN|nr:type VII secretion protein EccB [Epidermidibacterium keratini]QHC00873.1 type VII secretion protein EccB [Epidermidibacterium keratini]